ncbi:hypothetical protein, partial [Neisseria bacilliformis]|uniref:hypothetical protein n=1 Tax=Neisseria bacilliformis TaxID=267212 RepID=UPI0019552351
TLGCNLFVWGWGFLFRTVVRVGGDDVSEKRFPAATSEVALSDGLCNKGRVRRLYICIADPVPAFILGLY